MGNLLSRPAPEPTSGFYHLKFPRQSRRPSGRRTATLPRSRRGAKAIRPNHSPTPAKVGRRPADFAKEPHISHLRGTASLHKRFKVLAGTGSTNHEAWHIGTKTRSGSDIPQPAISPPLPSPTTTPTLNVRLQRETRLNVFFRRCLRQRTRYLTLPPSTQDFLDERAKEAAAFEAVFMKEMALRNAHRSLKMARFSVGVCMVLVLVWILVATRLRIGKRKKSLHHRHARRVDPKPSHPINPEVVRAHTANPPRPQTADPVCVIRLLEAFPVSSRHIPDIISQHWDLYPAFFEFLLTNTLDPPLLPLPLSPALDPGYLDLSPGSPSPRRLYSHALRELSPSLTPDPPLLPLPKAPDSELLEPPAVAPRSRRPYFLSTLQARHQTFSALLYVWFALEHDRVRARKRKERRTKLIAGRSGVGELEVERVVPGAWEVPTPISSIEEVDDEERVGEGVKTIGRCMSERCPHARRSSLQKAEIERKPSRKERLKRKEEKLGMVVAELAEKLKMDAEAIGSVPPEGASVDVEDAHPDDIEEAAAEEEVDRDTFVKHPITPSSTSGSGIQSARNDDNGPRTKLLGRMKAKVAWVKGKVKEKKSSARSKPPAPGVSFQPSEVSTSRVSLSSTLAEKAPPTGYSSSVDSDSEDGDSDYFECLSQDEVERHHRGRKSVASLETLVEPQSRDALKQKLLAAVAQETTQVKEENAHDQHMEEQTQDLILRYKSSLSQLRSEKNLGVQQLVQLGHHFGVSKGAGEGLEEEEEVVKTFNRDAWTRTIRDMEEYENSLLTPRTSFSSSSALASPVFTPPESPKSSFHLRCTSFDFDFPIPGDDPLDPVGSAVVVLHKDPVHVVQRTREKTMNRNEESGSRGSR